MELANKTIGSSRGEGKVNQTQDSARGVDSRLSQNTRIRNKVAQAKQNMETSG